MQLGRLKVSLTKQSHRPDVRLAFGTALVLDFCTPADGSLATLDLCVREVLPGLSDEAIKSVAQGKRIRVHNRVSKNLAESVLPGS